MSANLIDFGRRFLVWIVAFFGALEAIGEIAVAFLAASYLEAMVWFLVAVSMFALAGLVEKVKALREGF